MPSLKSALRVLLILVLLADGISAAWASTGMALKAAEHLKDAAADGSGKAGKATAKAAADCEPGSAQAGSGDGARRAGLHQDCDCANQVACACSCAISFYPALPGFRFNGPSLPDSQPLSTALVQPVLTPITAVFRPPIR